MKTVEFIKEFGLEALKTELAIEIKKYNGFFVLNYNQLDSPSIHPVVQECRGLILKDDLTVLCRSFNRFFNYGETPQITSKMAYEGAIAFNKIDGSLMVLYFNTVTGKWQFATRNAAFAEGVEKTLTYTMEELALMACNATSPEEFAGALALDPQFCYVFELSGPFNKVIKSYSKNELSLLAVADKFGGEWPFEEVKKLQTEMGKKYCVGIPAYVVLRNEAHLGELINACKELEEGFVVLNENLNLRVKAKSPGYLAAAHLKVKDGQHIPLRAATLVATGEHVEWLAYNPEDTELFDPYILARQWLKDKIHEVTESTKNICDQKELAAQVKNYPFSGLIFRARKENRSPWELYCSQDTKQQAKQILSALPFVK